MSEHRAVSVATMFWVEAEDDKTAREKAREEIEDYPVNDLDLDVVDVDDWEDNE